MKNILFVLLVAVATLTISSYKQTINQLHDLHLKDAKASMQLREILTQRQHEIKTKQRLAAQKAAERVKKQKAAQRRQEVQTQRIDHVVLAKPHVSGPAWIIQCKAWATQAGVTLPPAAINLIDKESDCNPNAVNPDSGACGIGQQLPCRKWAHPWNDPIGGLIDMKGYVMDRYGSWEAAWSFWLVNNHY